MGEHGKGGAVVAGQPARMDEARAAIAAVAPDFVRLVRQSADVRPVGPAVGTWTPGDVASHVRLVVEVDTDALAGRRLPGTPLRPPAVAAMNDAALAADPERDMGVLADRIEALLAEFLTVSGAPVSEEVTWLGGARLPASAVACHLLEELLVHGFDLATATGREWTIAPAHAALAIIGAVVPIVNGADPMAFVDPERALGFRARVEVRLRGHERFTFVFDDGMRIADGRSTAAGIRGPVDVHVSASPVSMLLLVLGRVRAPQAVLRGQVLAWGRRPWRLRRALSLMTPP